MDEEIAMDREEPLGSAALPKTGDGLAYGVVDRSGGPVHLSIGVGETLCNIEIDSAFVRATFGPNDCPTCLSMAEVRDLRIVIPRDPA